MTPDVAVIIPTFERAADLPGVLRALARQSLPAERFEVVVVDDCSSDGTVTLVEQFADASPFLLRVVRTATNRGPAAARNLGWAWTSAPIVAFLDDDCLPSPGWLEAGLAAFEVAPRPGVVQGATHLPEGASTYGLIDWWVWREVSAPTPFFDGSNLWFQRKALEATGGFDEDIRHYGEDCAAGWRVCEAGFPSGFAPEAKVTHPIEQRGFRWFVRNGYLESRIVACAAKHAGFRQEAFWRPWAYRREDPALLAAAAGVVLAVRWRPALLLALPYVYWRRPSVRHLNFFRLCWQIPAVDAARIAGHLRGSIDHRVLVL